MSDFDCCVGDDLNITFGKPTFHNPMVNGVSIVRVIARVGSDPGFVYVHVPVFQPHGMLAGSVSIPFVDGSASETQERIITKICDGLVSDGVLAVDAKRGRVDIPNHRWTDFYERLVQLGADLDGV